MKYLGHWAVTLGLLGAAMAAPAATFRVYQLAPDTGLEWNSVAEAFTAALVTAGSHTIQIEDNNGGAGYSEPLMDLTAAANKDITITALVAVTISNSGTGSLFRNLSSTTPEKKLSIIGASTVAPITLYSAAAAGIITFANPESTNRNGLLHLENVVLEKSTTAPDGYFIELNSRATGQQYLSHVDFKGGAPTNLSTLARLGSQNTGFRQDLYMEHVSFAQAGGANAMMSVNNMADIAAVNCVFRPAVGSSMFCVRGFASNSGLAAVGGAAVTFRDCEFQSVNGGGVKDAFILLGENFQTVRNVYRFYRPEFYACGSNIFALNERPAEVYVLGLDDSDQPTVPKVNLDTAPVSVLRYARLYGNNKVSFQHCKAYEPLSASIKSFGGNDALLGSPEVELINCDFTGTGIVAFNGGASSFAPVIKITNSVLLGGLLPLPFLSTVSGNAVPAQITFENSTLTKNSATFFTANLADLIYAPGTIFDCSLGTLVCSVGLQASAVPTLSWTSLGTSGFPSVPPGTVVAAPNLDATGRLTINSVSAFNGAVGSVLTTDIDNEARPQPAAAAANDLGADESAYPVTDLALGNNTIGDDAVNGALVGAVIITDPDQDTSLALTDNGDGAFGLSGNDLVVADSAQLNGITTPTVLIEITATDLGGAVYTEQFTISVAHIAPFVVSAEVITAQSVRVTFSRPMNATALVSGNYTLSGTGQGTFGVNPDDTTAQSATIYDLTWSAPAEMFIGGDVTIAVANTVQDALGGALGVPASATDLGGGLGTAPTLDSVVASVTSPTNADDIDFTFSFSEPVQDFVAASAEISASGTAYAAANVSGGPADYTLALSGITGDGSLGAALAALATTRDLAGNPVVPGGPSASIVLDNTPPGISAITALDTNPTNAASVDFGVVFTEDVTGFDVADTALTATEGVLNGASVAAVAQQSPAAYTVTAARGTGDLTFRLDVSAGATISDLVGNPYVGPFTSGEAYVIRELRITTQPAPSTFATAGDSVALTVGVTGGVLPRGFQWYYAADSSGPFSPLPDGAVNTLEISPLAVEDTGYYYAVVSDANESVGSAQAFLGVDSGVPLLAPAGVALLLVALAVVGARRR